jgi:hypothetical protein
MKVTEILSNFNLFHGIKKMEIKSEKVAWKGNFKS